MCADTNTAANDLISLQELAQYLRLDPKTVVRLAAGQGLTLIAGKHGSYHYLRAEVDLWLDACACQPAA